eukprot:gene23337-28239_t
MLENSVGDCYFVTLFTTASPGKNQLDEDAAFFNSRLAYISVARSGIAAREKWYNYPIHWYGGWMIAEVVQELHKIPVPDSTIVIRSRPDICFRDCFDFTQAQKVFSEHKYLMIGQLISADNNFFTNAVTYKEKVAALLYVNDQQWQYGQVNGWSRGSSDAWGKYCEVDGDIACAVPFYEGWNNHCLCRVNDEHLCTNGQEGPSVVEPTKKGQCVDITKGVKCVYPTRTRWNELPPGRRPPQNVSVKDFDVGYFPNGQVTLCMDTIDL